MKYPFHPLKKQNYAQYTLGLSTQWLLPGLVQNITRLPKTRHVTVSLDTASVVELFSQGMSDVSAVLSTGDESNKVIDKNDDALNDWNFKISRVLAPGRYRLSVASEDGASRNISVVMNQRPEKKQHKWDGQQSGKVKLDNRIHLISITIPELDNILHITATSDTRVGFSLSQNNKLLEQGSGTQVVVSAPVNSGETYKLRLWATSISGTVVHYKITCGRSIEVPLNRLMSGYKPKKKATLQWLKVDMGQDSLSHITLAAKGTTIGVRNSARVNQAFRNGNDNSLSSINRFQWIELTAGTGVIKKIFAHFLDIEGERRLSLRADPRAFRRSQPQKVSLLNIRSQTGLPMAGVAWGQPDFSIGGIITESGQKVEKSSAACVQGPGQNSPWIIWNASPDAANVQVDIDVQEKNFDFITGESLKVGIQIWQAARDLAKEYKVNLRPHSKITLKLPITGKALWRPLKGKSQQALARDAATPFEFTASKGTLYLVNDGAKANFEISVREGINQISHRWGEGYFNPGQPEGLSVPCGSQQRRVSFSGAVTDVRYWDPFGHLYMNISNGWKVPIQTKCPESVNQGYLVFSPLKGWGKATTCREDKSRSCGWHASQNSSNPIRVTNASEYKLNNGTNWFKTQIKDTTHLRLYSQHSLVVLLKNKNGAVRTDVGVDGLDVSYPLTPGAYTIGIRGMGTLPAAHKSVSFAFYPIERFDEESSPNAMLMAGESRLFKFFVKKPQNYGLAIKGDAEVIDMRLLDASLSQLAEGKQIFTSLKKGTYYLWCQVPTSSAPTAFSPIIVGQKAPPDTPPEKVIQRITGGTENENE